MTAPSRSSVAGQSGLYALPASTAAWFRGTPAIGRFFLIASAARDWRYLVDRAIANGRPALKNPDYSDQTGSDEGRADLFLRRLLRPRAGSSSRTHSHPSMHAGLSLGASQSIPLAILSLLWRVPHLPPDLVSGMEVQLRAVDVPQLLSRTATY
jgi:hypothetical protein